MLEDNDPRPEASQECHAPRNMSHAHAWATGAVNTYGSLELCNILLLGHGDILPIKA